MSLKHAILGFLGYRSCTGYDLKRMFDSTVRHFWPADQSQIYRTLARLEEDGHVRMELVPQEDRPDRKLYHVTEDGRDELRQWLLSPLPPPEAREATLIQLFFAGAADDRKVLEQLRHYLQGTRMGLARYEGIELGDILAEEELGDERDGFYQALTLDHGIAMMRAEVAWLEGVVALLEDRLDQ
jgi:DNA-binding PadR family transcriptional regulator